MSMSAHSRIFKRRNEYISGTLNREHPSHKSLRLATLKIFWPRNSIPAHRSMLISHLSTTLKRFWALRCNIAKPLVHSRYIPYGDGQYGQSSRHRYASVTENNQYPVGVTLTFGAWARYETRNIISLLARYRPQTLFFSPSAQYSFFCLPNNTQPLYLLCFIRTLSSYSL